MLRTRQDLFDRAFALYLPLLEKAARRYRSGEVPTRIDHVGFSCTMLEELFRPLWGIAPLLLERPMTIRIGGEQKDVPSFYGELMTEGTDPDSPAALTAMSRTMTGRYLRIRRSPRWPGI